MQWGYLQTAKVLLFGEHKPPFGEHKPPFWEHVAPF